MSIQLNRSNDNICVAFIKNIETKQIIQKIFVTNKYEGSESVSNKNKNFVVNNNTLTLNDPNLILEFNPELQKDQNHRMLIIGQSGSGKSYWLGSFLNEFKKKYPKYKILLFSRHEYDSSIDDRVKGIIRVGITEQEAYEAEKFKQPLFNMTDLKKTFCLFDDVFSASKILNKYYTMLMNDIVTNGRKYQINIASCIHNTDYSKTRFLLSEATCMVFFLNSSKSLNKRIMIQNLGLDLKDVEKLLSIKNSRWILIKNTNPLFIMTEKSIFTESNIN